MSSQRDYTSYSFLTTILVIAAMAGLSQLPRFKLGSLTFKRTNILADIIKQEESPELLEADQYFDTTFLNEAAAMKVIDSATRSAERDTLSLPEAKLEEWNIATDRPAAAPILLTKPAGADQNVVPIELFSPDAMMRFNRALTRGAAGRPVRIAVLGDSFIEGDIITADLREQLQLRYGGRGCGFAPMSSPLTGYRRTVGTRSAGWNSYNIMQRRTTPEALRGDYSVSGWLCRPADGATVRWTGSDFRRRLDRCGVARLLFISREPSRLELTLNDSLHRTFDIPASEALRQIVVRAPVASLALRVVRGGAGFTGYGVQFEDAAGVTVDNYSIRSNNGQALFGTNPSVNAQIDAFAEYDLVILQYGLNIMQEGVTNYSAYAARVEKMIAFVRSCFPEAAVLVLSTSDRSVKSDTGFAPMSSAPAMVDWQRRAARATGAAFWSVYDAMRAQGGMERFVANGWAGKDYTHINYAGGRQVAYALVDALDARVAAILRQRQQAALPEPVLDSSKIAALDETMNLRPQPIEPR